MRMFAAGSSNTHQQETRNEQTQRINMYERTRTTQTMQHPPTRQAVSSRESLDNDTSMLTSPCAYSGFGLSGMHTAMRDPCLEGHLYENGNTVRQARELRAMSASQEATLRETSALPEWALLSVDDSVGLRPTTARCDGRKHMRTIRHEHESKHAFGGTSIPSLAFDFENRAHPHMEDNTWKNNQYFKQRSKT